MNEQHSLMHPFRSGSGSIRERNQFIANAIAGQPRSPAWQRIRQYNAREQLTQLRRLFKIDARSPEFRAAHGNTGNVTVGKIDAGKSGLKSSARTSRHCSNVVFVRVQPPSAENERSQPEKRAWRILEKLKLLYRETHLSKTTSSRNASEKVAPTSLQSVNRVRSNAALGTAALEQSQCSRIQSMNAARSSVQPVIWQPANRQLRNVKPG